MYIVVTNKADDAYNIIKTAGNFGVISNIENCLYAVLTTSNQSFSVTKEMMELHTESSVFGKINVLVNNIIIKAPSPLLINNDFGLCWLAIMAKAAPVILLGLPESVQATNPRLTVNRLKECKDVFSVREVSDGCIELTLASDSILNMDNESFYDFLQNKFSTLLAYIYDKTTDFIKLYENVSSEFIDKERLMPEFSQRQLIYTLMGVLQKGVFLENILKLFFQNRHIRMLDLGAGYGALAVEVALKGHQCTGIEMESAKVDKLASWLANSCNVSSRMDMITGSFDMIKKIKEPYEIISFFGSLLYQPREHLDELLHTCREKLTDDGILIIHEFPVSKSSPDAVDFHRQFSAPELENYLLKHFSSTHYYSIFNHNEITLEDASDSVILVLASKS